MSRWHNMIKLPWKAWLKDKRWWSGFVVGFVFSTSTFFVVGMSMGWVLAYGLVLLFVHLPLSWYEDHLMVLGGIEHRGLPYNWLWKNKTDGEYREYRHHDQDKATPKFTFWSAAQSGSSLVLTLVLLAFGAFLMKIFVQSILSS